MVIRRGDLSPGRPAEREEARRGPGGDALSVITTQGGDARRPSPIRVDPSRIREIEMQRSFIFAALSIAALGGQIACGDGSETGEALEAEVTHPGKGGHGAHGHGGHGGHGGGGGGGGGRAREGPLPRAPPPPP